MIVRTLLTSAALLTLLLGASAAAGPAAAEPGPQTGLEARWEVRVRMDGPGRTKFPVVGVVERAADGLLRVEGRNPPELEALSTPVEERWAAWKKTDEVSVTQMIPSDTGMHPSYSSHTVSFRRGERLFAHAQLREFFARYDYGDLGVSHMKYIEYDLTAESPPNAHDRSADVVNVRKGDGEDLHFDPASRSTWVWVYAKVRPPNPPGEGRRSASDPTLVLATNNDLGEEEIGRFIVYEDGRVTLERSHAGDVFVRDFAPIGVEDVEVATYGADGVWGKLAVPRSSPHIAEAFILFRQSHDFYDVVPVIDPARLR